MLGYVFSLIFHNLRISVNSSSTLIPFRNKHTLFGIRWGSAYLRRIGSGASARAVTTSAASAELDSIRLSWIVTVTSDTRAASRRKAHFRALASIRWTSGTPMIARTNPGNPAPLPRSTKRWASGGSRAKSCAESSIWRRHGSAIVDLPTRLTRSFHLASRAPKRFNRSSVSRETSAAAANPSASSGSGTGIRHAAPDIAQQSDSRGRGNTGNPRRGPNRAGSGRRQLLANLGRKAANGGVVQIVRQS